MSSPTRIPAIRSQIRSGRARCFPAVLAAAMLLQSCVTIRPTDGPAHSLDNAPPPENYIALGIVGLYGQLRTAPPGASTPPPLQSYLPYAKFDTAPDSKRFNVRQIVVKLAQGSALRLRAGQLETEQLAMTGDRQSRLARAGVSAAQVTGDVSAINIAVKAARASMGRASPGVQEDDLQRLHDAAELASGREQPDPNLFYFVHLPARTTALEAAALLALLQRIGSVETAYFQPIPFDAQVDQAPPTLIDVTGAQGYFRPAPTGIDVDLVGKIPGGDGSGVRVADIEVGWTPTHEDLPPMEFRIGVNFGGDHGTAVLGEVVAGRNAYGANGIAPAATIGWSSATNLDFLSGNVFFYSVAGALLNAGRVLRAGDIALIEQHFPNLFAGPCPNTCNCGQFGYVAVETIPFEHAAISLLTAAGVIVVEAAGNGQTLVTPASPIDSGAIIVGASNTGLMPACFTNFGPRVNVHAWGMSIGTLGYGGDTVTPDPTLRANLSDPNQWYTRNFGGTSGASPIIVGAAALIQSLRMARGLAPLLPLQMRALLVSTGTPQVVGSGVAIGPLPNLAAAAASFIPDAATFVSQVGAPVTIAPGQTFTLITQFDNTGSRRWTGSHRMSVAPSATSGQQEFSAPSLPEGSPAAPVVPGDRVTGAMQVLAPAQPGSYRLVVDLADPASIVLARSTPVQVAVATVGTPVDNATLVIDSAPNSLHVGETGKVTVTATNIGTTTWSSPGYILRLTRTMRISLPANTVQLTGGVGQGQSQTLQFDVVCSSQGSGGWSATRASNTGTFGQSVGRNVVCQP